MIRAIRAWWRSFRRDCVRTSLIRHHGFAPDEVTEQILDDVQEIIERLKGCPLKVTATEVIAAYRFDRDVEAVFAAVDFLIGKGALVTREMILWTIGHLGL